MGLWLWPGFENDPFLDPQKSAWTPVENLKACFFFGKFLETDGKEFSIRPSTSEFPEEKQPF